MINGFTLLLFLQTDLDYRQQWDKLIIKLSPVEKDDNSGCEVIQWIIPFPVSVTLSE